MSEWLQCLARDGHDALTVSVAPPVWDRGEEHPYHRIPVTSRALGSWFRSTRCVKAVGDLSC